MRPARSPTGPAPRAACRAAAAGLRRCGGGAECRAEAHSVGRLLSDARPPPCLPLSFPAPVRCFRMDVELTNGRGERLVASHFLPTELWKTRQQLPCVIYCARSPSGRGPPRLRHEDRETAQVAQRSQLLSPPPRNRRRRPRQRRLPRGRQRCRLRAPPHRRQRVRLRLRRLRPVGRRHRDARRPRVGRPRHRRRLPPGPRPHRQHRFVGAQHGSGDVRALRPHQPVHCGRRAGLPLRPPSGPDARHRDPGHHRRRALRAGVRGHRGAAVLHPAPHGCGHCEAGRGGRGCRVLPARPDCARGG